MFVAGEKSGGMVRYVCILTAVCQNCIKPNKTYSLKNRNRRGFKHTNISLYSISSEATSQTCTPHLIDSLSSESICHPFAGHGRSHEGNDVLQPTGQLKHDDYERHRHTSHPTWRKKGGERHLQVTQTWLKRQSDSSEMSRKTRSQSKM